MRLQLLITAKSGDHPSMGAGWLILGASLSVVGALAPATPCLGRTWHVPVDAPTIQAGIDSAAAGDHVHVAPGVYCEHDIILKGDVLVRSEEGAGVTTVDAEGLGRGFYADRLGAVAAIEGFTIRNGMTDGYGGGVGAWQTPFRISSCMVINCVAGVGGGVYASGPRLEVIDCIVLGCVSTVSGGGIALRPVEAGSIVGCEIIDNEVTYGDGGGIAAGGYTGQLIMTGCSVRGNRATNGPGGGISCLSPELTIENCVVVENTSLGWWGAAGISASSASGRISRCTISRNNGILGDGAYLSGAVLVERTVASFNGGIGVGCDWDAEVSFSCCDLFGNGDGDDICGEDLGGNFSADPLFCDPEGGDYTLNANSPCLPGNHPDGEDCGLIGALREGCGAVPVKEETWGRIRAGYR